MPDPEQNTSFHRLGLGCRCIIYSNSRSPFENLLDVKLATSEALILLYHYIFLYPFSRSSLSIFLIFSSSLVSSILLYLCRLCVLRFQSLVTPSLFNHPKYLLFSLVLFDGSARSRFLTVCIFVPRPLQLCLGSLSGGNVPPPRIKIWHRTMRYLPR